MLYRIAGNFCKPKFSENSFQWIFRKNIFEIFGYLSFFATGLKNFKAPFRKKIWEIPEVSEITENKVLRKFPAIQYYNALSIYHYIVCTVDMSS